MAIDTSNKLDEEVTPGLRTTRGPLYDDAVLGFREYWYPAMLSSHLGKKPQAVRLLGEQLVFLRANGKPYALRDRCAHRGMMLSRGVCLAEGTLTCPYHGWTFDVTTGELVAALTDGPESTVVGKRGKLVPTYPAEEHKGIIYVFMGHGSPPPIADDVPDELLDESHIQRVVVNDWACNWRPAVENGHDAAHAAMVHMNSARWRFSRGRSIAWGTHSDNMVKGKYLHRRFREMGYSGVYPRVGQWPKHHWLRRMIQRAGKRDPNLSNSFRLPSMIRNGYTGYAMVRWVVPIDESRCRNFMFLTGHCSGLARLRWLAKYWLWHRWAFCTWFTAQDQRIVENLDYDAPEILFRPDSSIVGLRKYIETNVRTFNQHQA